MRSTPTEQRGALPLSPRREAARRRPAVGTSVPAPDVGAYYISGTVMTTDGRVRLCERRYALPERGTDAVVDTTLGCATDPAGPADRLRTPVSAAGLVLSGSADELAGVPTTAEPEWAARPLRSWMEEHLDVPVLLGHERHARGVAGSRLRG
ncbi:hypothetical protein [Streptomyces sp. BE303]|uniref:hypothetical protein n=1 Tax=Streptomyces sp. BE303 TaxID=3002528 RepID=UPI002E76DA12|nr:hypothetical protein [Streptomyces sp. BE303]MED7947509.1 hypothetical protein [Streptomyces sp. BE303]